MLRRNEGIFMTEMPNKQTLRVRVVGTVNMPQEKNWKDNETFTKKKKMLTYRLTPNEAPMVRLGTINMQDVTTLSNLFGITKGEVLDMGLKGHLALEVDYRVVTPRSEVPSGRRPTEAGPSLETKVAATFMRSVASGGPLPLLRNVPGEDNPAQTASGHATSSLIVTTGSAGNQPGESSGQKSKQALKRATKTQKISSIGKVVKFAKTVTKRFNSELRLM